MVGNSVDKHFEKMNTVKNRRKITLKSEKVKFRKVGVARFSIWF